MFCKKKLYLIDTYFLFKKKQLPPSLECGYGFLQCNDGSCVPGRKCDGYPDCNDYSDETNCTTCGQFQFRCKDGQCISEDLRCNNLYDCTDGSDEENCGMSLTDECLSIIKHSIKS